MTPTWYWILLLMGTPCVGAYAVLLLKLRRSWLRTPVYEVPTVHGPTLTLSVLIAARNEAQSLPLLLGDLSAQQYPSELWEACIIDDYSDDGTSTVVLDFIARHPHLPIRLLSLAAQPACGSGKKQAISWGVANTTGKFIVTTDADCRVTPQWLSTLAAFAEHTGAQLIAAPVLFRAPPQAAALHRWQALDMGGLMGITAGGIASGWLYMCNGANLAYARQLFYSVQGFQGSDTLASGDDVFLLHKSVQIDPSRIRFLRSTAAIVTTSPQPSIGRLLSQRVRWASKSGAYTHRPTQAASAMVWACCFSINVLLAAMPWGGSSAPIAVGLLWATKASADYLLLHTTARYWQQPHLLRPLTWWGAQCWHTLYIPLVGLIALFRPRYRWKGRLLR